jgi:histidinol-phosphate phosphatase family protein
VVIKPGRAEVLGDLLEDGYLLLGVSNQSGIGKGVFTDEAARSCFRRTNSELGIHIEYVYCPHRVPPSSCYCRKPQSGMGVHFIRKYNLDPAQCIMVGDQTTDKTFAKRLGFQYQSAENFFK